MTIEERFDMILLVGEKHRRIADIAQVVVRILGKDEVTSSSLVSSSDTGSSAASGILLL